MSVFQVASWRTAVVGRWAARIAGVRCSSSSWPSSSAKAPDLSRLTPAERIQALAMVASFLGLVIAWKWEGLGGLLTVAGFALTASIPAISVCGPFASPR